MVDVEGEKRIDEFINRQKELLNLEKVAHAKRDIQELREHGDTIWVEVVTTRVPNYGGTLVTFKPRQGKDSKKPPSFRSGNMVGVDVGDGSEMLHGILVNVKIAILEVHVKDSEAFFLDRKFYELVKISEEGTFEQMELALDGIRQNKFKLRNILFGLCQPSSPMTKFYEKYDKLDLLNNNLDCSQREAVEFALKQKELAVVHGPPGTGKTTTVVEIICQAVKAGDRVLVSAPSNVAVDNLAERLANQGQKVVRIGHPARIAEQVHPYALDVIVEEQTRIVQDIQAKMVKTRLKLEKLCYRGEYEKMEHLELDMKTLTKQMKKEKMKLDNKKKAIIKKAKIVLGTLTGCGTKSPLKFLPSKHFQLTVIDECSQSQEMACWIVIPRSPKLILAGDHLQLPPTILAKKAEKELSLTLMERLLDRYWYTVIKMLTVQYRMNSLIMNWSSTTFYMGKLYPALQVADHKLSDLGHVTKCGLTDTVLMMIDTAGKGMEESKSASKVAPSFANLGEAAVVVHHVKSLVQRGVKPGEIAIVTPYSFQVDLLSANLLEDYPELEIKSVDGFQGREKEVVILSMVRSNAAHNLGFLVEKRRLNVGVTRARRQLVLVCDSQTVSKDEFLQKFVNHVRENGTSEAPAKTLDMSRLILPIDFKKVKQTNKKKTISTKISQGSKLVNKGVAFKAKDLATELFNLCDIVGMDCEMVGIGEDGEESMLARVSIVNHLGKTILDTFVSITEPVTDYRTEFSGVRPKNLEGAPDFNLIRKKVFDILKGQLLVGHGLDHDMEVLGLYFPKHMVRDTAKYWPFVRGRKTPSLKSLASKFLGLTIQTGEHSSVEDAQAALQLYLKYRKEWEKKLKSVNKPTKPTKPTVIQNAQASNITSTGKKNKRSRKKKKKSTTGASGRMVMVEPSNENVSTSNKQTVLSSHSKETTIQNPAGKKRKRSRKKKPSTESNDNKTEVISESIVTNSSFSKFIEKSEVVNSSAQNAIQTSELKGAQKKKRRRPRKGSKQTSASGVIEEASMNTLNNNIEALVNKTSKLSLENKNNQKEIGKLQKLQTLKPDHQFCKEDFDNLFWQRCSKFTIRKNEARIEWGQIWLKIRKDRPNSAVLNPNMLIHDAFNMLSNIQLENWIELQREKLNFRLIMK